MNKNSDKNDLPPKGTRLCDMTPAQRAALLDQVVYGTGILTKNTDGRWYDERGLVVDLTESISERPVLRYAAPVPSPGGLGPTPEPSPPASYDALLGARKSLNEIGAAVGLPEWSDPDRVARAASARIASLEKDVGAATDRAQVAVSKAEAERDQARRGRDALSGRVRELEDVVRKKLAELSEANARTIRAQQARDEARALALAAVSLESLLDEVARRARRGAK